RLRQRLRLPRQPAGHGLQPGQPVAVAQCAERRCQQQAGELQRDRRRPPARRQPGDRCRDRAGRGDRRHRRPGPQGPVRPGRRRGGRWIAAAAYLAAIGASQHRLATAGAAVHRAGGRAAVGGGSGEAGCGHARPGRRRRRRAGTRAPGRGAAGHSADRATGPGPVVPAARLVRAPRAPRTRRRAACACAPARVRRRVLPVARNALDPATTERPGRPVGRWKLRNGGRGRHVPRTPSLRDRKPADRPPWGGPMRGAFASRANRTVRLLWLLELAVLLLSVTVAVWLRFIDDPASRGLFVETAPVRTLLVALFVTGAMAAFGLYQPHVRHNRIDLMLRIGLGFAFGGVGLLVLYYLVPATYIGRGVLAISLAIGFVL